MGTGNWLKTIISRKKVKVDKLKQLQGCSASEKPTESKSNSDGYTTNTSKANVTHIELSEDVAATRIQTVFRAYLARKAVRRMKGVIRLQKMTQAESIRKQSTSTLTHLQAWSRIQSQIRDRRTCMVAEGRVQRKKLENQIELEAKIHGLEVEWNGGYDTMEEILARLQQREDASLKRERALAYAFTHRWKGNSGEIQGSNASEVGKSNWGWSWKERWIAARPWENRVASHPSKGKKSSKPMSLVLNEKMLVKPRRLSFPGAEKPGQKVSKANDQEPKVKKKRDSVS